MIAEDKSWGGSLRGITFNAGGNRREPGPFRGGAKRLVRRWGRGLAEGRPSFDAAKVRRPRGVFAAELCRSDPRNCCFTRDIMQFECTTASS